MTKTTQTIIAIAIVVAAIAIILFAAHRSSQVSEEQAQVIPDTVPAVVSPTGTVRAPAASQKKAAGSHANGDVSALTSHEWVWQRTIAPNDANTAPKKPTSFVLTFATDGHVSSKTDCNAVSGSYSVSGTSLTFGPFMSTLMYCQGSDEGVYTTQLKNVNSYAIGADGNLVLMLANDKGSMTFTKKF